MGDADWDDNASVESWPDLPTDQQQDDGELPERPVTIITLQLLVGAWRRGRELHLSPKT